MNTFRNSWSLKVYIIIAVKMLSIYDIIHLDYCTIISVRLVEPTWFFLEFIFNNIFDKKTNFL